MVARLDADSPLEPYGIGEESASGRVVKEQGANPLQQFSVSATAGYDPALALRGRLLECLEEDPTRPLSAQRVDGSILSSALRNQAFA
jgi:hypothetical protein